MELKEFEKLLQDKLDQVTGKVKELIKDGMSENDSRIKALETDIAAIRESIENVKGQQKKRDLTTVAGLSENLKKEPFSLGAHCQALYHIANGVPEEKAFARANAGYELEVLQAYAKINDEARKRENFAGDGSQGGYLVPQEVTGEIVNLAIANMPIMSLGPRVLNGLVGDLPIPRVTGRHSGYWLGETEAPTESEAAFAQAWLRPKKAGAFTKVSNRLLFQTRGVADTIIKELLAEEMQLTMESGWISGNGTDSEPLGIESSTTNMTATTVTVTGLRFRIDDAGVMQEDLDNANELKMVGKFGYLMHPRVKGGLKRERVLHYAGQTEKLAGPVIPGFPLLSDKAIEDLIGYPIASTTLVRSNRTLGGFTTGSRAYFGNWSQFYIGLWRDMVIKVSDTAGDSTGSAFRNDQSWIVAFKETDSQLIRRSSFTYVDGLETTKSRWT